MECDENPLQATSRCRLKLLTTDNFIQRQPPHSLILLPAGACREQARSSNSSKAFSLTLKTWETPEGSPQQMRTSLCTQQAFAVHGTNRGCFATGRAQIGSGATNPPDLMRALRDTSHLVSRDLCAALHQELSLDVESSSWRSVRQ